MARNTQLRLVPNRPVRPMSNAQKDAARRGLSAAREALEAGKRRAAQRDTSPQAA